MQTSSNQSLKIVPIPAFTDNYIWAITLKGSNLVTVVDPGCSKAVIEFIENNSYQLDSILVTHHHNDHIGGIDRLWDYSKDKGWEISVYGPEKENIPHSLKKLSDGDSLMLASFNITFNIIDLPGHTLGHIAYYSDGIVFCGDTLFSAGCGRLFEGTAEQLHNSLQKLAKLPDSTQVYCTHEYTKANLAFALTVEPTNMALINYYNQVVAKRELNIPSLPSSIGLEKEINPFLRSHIDEVQQSVSQFNDLPMSDPVITFAALRKWKDNF